MSFALLLSGCAGESVAYVTDNESFVTAESMTINTAEASEYNSIGTEDTESAGGAADLSDFTWEDSFKANNVKVKIKIKKIENIEEIETASVITVAEIVSMTQEDKKSFLDRFFDGGKVYVYNEKSKGIIGDMDDKIEAEDYTADIFYGYYDNQLYAVHFMLNKVDQYGDAANDSYYVFDRRIEIYNMDHLIDLNDVLTPEIAKEKAEEVMGRIQLDGLKCDDAYDIFGKWDGDKDFVGYDVRYFQGEDAIAVRSKRNYDLPIEVIDDNGDTYEAYYDIGRRNEVDVHVYPGSVVYWIIIHKPIEIKEQVNDVNILNPEYIKELVKKELTDNLVDYTEGKPLGDKDIVQISKMEC